MKRMLDSDAVVAALEKIKAGYIEERDKELEEGDHKWADYWDHVVTGVGRSITEVREMANGVVKKRDASKRRNHRRRGGGMIHRLKNPTSQGMTHGK